MDEFASALPTLTSPSTPVQDELLVPCHQGNIVSVQPLGVKTEPAPVPTEMPQPPPATEVPAATEAPTAPPAPEPAPVNGAPASPPPQDQGPPPQQADPRRVQFTGELVVTDNSFSVNINGGECNIM